MAADIAFSATTLLAGIAPAAYAKCVPPPPQSPAVFTGVVESVEGDGLIAGWWIRRRTRSHAER